MFVAAFPRGLHFQVEAITDEVMPLGLRAAPLVNGGWSKARDYSNTMAAPHE
jgi:hypothetical protein